MKDNIKNYEEFEQQLTELLKMELRHYANHFVRDTMHVFDLGCFPWHSMFELSFLTDYEPNLDPEYKANPADWRLYNFTSNISYGSWYAARNIAAWMNKQYEADPSALEKILASCARCLTSAEVMEVLEKHYILATDFKVSVVDPDDPEGNNFCQNLTS